MLGVTLSRKLSVSRHVSDLLSRYFPSLFALRTLRHLHGQIDEWMPYNFAADSNFVADFLQAKCDFTRKTAVLRYW